MAKYTLYIVTYQRGTYTTGQVKPYHWAFFISQRIEGACHWGIAHQLRGMPGNFHYDGPENVDLWKSGNRKVELEIGEVDESKLARVHEIASNVRIDTVESSGWNCQDWALDAFEQMQQEEFITVSLSREALKYWLKENE